MNFCGNEAPHDIYTTDDCMKVTFYNSKRFSFSGHRTSNYIVIEVDTVKRDRVQRSTCSAYHRSVLSFVMFFFSFLFLTVCPSIRPLKGLLFLFKKTLVNYF